jgi:hypothetical protein
MGDDRTADAQAMVLEPDVRALLVKVKAELRELELDGVDVIATADEDLSRKLMNKRAEVANLEKLAAEVAQRFDLRPVGEVGPNWLEERLPPRPALLTRAGKPWLIQGKVGLLLAEGGMGKTWTLLQLAVAVATGGKLFDTLEATKGRVLVALGEEDRDEVRRRLFDVVKALGLSDYERAEVKRNLTVIGLAGHDTAILTRGEKGEPVPSKKFETLRAALKAAGSWKCIMLDPWSRWGGPDVEIDNHAATRGIELLEQLTALEGDPTVLVAHHVRKAGKDGAASGGSADDGRGASGLKDGARWVANLMPAPKQLKHGVTLKVTKHNHTATSDDLLLVRTDNGPLRVATAEERAEATGEGSSGAKEKKETGRPTPAERLGGRDEGDPRVD